MEIFDDEPTEESLQVASSGCHNTDRLRENYQIIFTYEKDSVQIYK